MTPCFLKCMRDLHHEHKILPTKNDWSSNIPPSDLCYVGTLWRVLPLLPTTGSPGAFLLLTRQRSNTCKFVRRALVKVLFFVFLIIYISLLFFLHPPPLLTSAMNTHRWLEVEGWRNPSQRPLEPVMTSLATACKQISTLVRGGGGGIERTRSETKQP